MIESVQNERVKKWAKLQEKKYRDETNQFLIESEHLVEEALKQNLVKELIVLNGYEKEYKMDYTVVNESVMKKITSQMTPPHVCAVCQKKKEEDVNGNFLLLDDISDPGNLGTIIRSAVAFNIPNLILSLNCVDLYNPKVIRSCEGMIFHINIVRTDVFKFLDQLPPEYEVYGTDVVTGKNIKEISFSKGHTGIMIGNEGRGLKNELKSYCKENLYIPMNSKCESLNAAISASIIMYELNQK